MGLTDRTELSQQLSPHAKYHIHGGLGQEVFFTKGSFPAITARFLPGLTTCRTHRRHSFSSLAVLPVSP